MGLGPVLVGLPVLRAAPPIKAVNRAGDSRSRDQALPAGYCGAKAGRKVSVFFTILEMD
jgi:hypothetical protein